MTILSTGAYDLPAAADRNRNSLMLAKGSTSLAVIDGVHSGMSITKTTGMGFNIGPGRAAVNAASAADGTFTAVITANEPDAFAAGHASLDRIDLVVLQTYPNNPSATGVKVEVVTGTAASTPAVPAVPAGALALFQVKIGAGVSAGNGGWNTTQVTDRRRAIGVPEFQSYTPTWNGFDNLGTGAIREGRYRLDGDKCSINVRLHGGTGTAMGTGSFLSFTLPIPAKEGWMYYGLGAIHHQGMSGLAYDLRVMSNGSSAFVWAPRADGALIQPGAFGYPWVVNSELYCTLEYIIDLP